MKSPPHPSPQVIFPPLRLLTTLNTKIASRFSNSRHAICKCYLIGEMYLYDAVNKLPASMYDYICVYSLRHNTGVRLQAIWCYFLPSSGKSLNFMDNEQLPPLP